MQNPLENITIRPYGFGDIPRLYDAMIESKSTLTAWMPWSLAGDSIAETQKWVAAQTTAFGRGEEYAFAVLDGSGRLVGGCELDHVDQINRYANASYWTRISCLGKGVATKALGLMVTWAFANTNLYRLEILVSEKNNAGRRVAEKAGAVFVGLMEARLCLMNRMHDAAMYVFLKP